MSGSVPFDRAAEFYDASRAISPDAMARTIALLSGELGGRGRALEVGVGTGLLAIELHDTGIPLVGLDLSGPMIAKLVEKAGGRAPFPLVLGDATAMPFPEDAFGGAYLRWVLHLIPAWREVLGEVVRVVRPSGVFVANLGSYGGTHRQIQERFEELTGASTKPVGLGWAAFDELDAEMARFGATTRILPPLDESFEEPLEDFIRGIEENRYSWTWRVAEDIRLQAMAEILPWAEERFGSLQESRAFSLATRWRAYDLP